jgi:hypothetical protein
MPVMAEISGEKHNGHSTMAELALNDVSIAEKPLKAIG